MMRVKILFNKKEVALVQMWDSTQAQLGNTHLQTHTPADQDLLLLLLIILLHASSHEPLERSEAVWQVCVRLSVQTPERAAAP